MTAAAPKATTTAPPTERDAGRPRWRRLMHDLAPVAGAAILFLLAWQAIVIIGDYPPYILPGPAVVAERFVSGWIDGIIGPHFWTTLSEVLLGLTVGAMAGILTGILLARSRLAARMLSPYIVAAQATPILALAPLIALWLGTNLGSRVLICALICFFPIAVGTMVGIRSVDPRLIELGRSFRANRRQRLTHIEVPSALPQIMGSLRIGVTLAVVGAIVAVNFVICVGIKDGYEASISDVFRQNMFAGIVTVVVLVAGPVFGIVVARRLRRKRTRPQAD